MSLKTTECKGCGADMVWMTTQNGKSIPVDPETIGDQDAEIFDPDTMTTHFETCSEADKFRRKKK